MARKFCSVCKHLNGGRAVDCVCGHVFAASTIVVPKTTKTCPTCLPEQPKLANAKAPLPSVKLLV